MSTRPLPGRTEDYTKAASVGRRGRVTWGGSLSDQDPEENPELRGTRRFRIFREMLNEAKVREARSIVSLPISQAAWDIPPVDDSPEAGMVAAACRTQLGIVARGEKGWLRDGWKDTLNSSLLFLFYGSMTKELLWSENIVQWSPDGGSTRPIRPIRVLEQREPETISRFIPAGVDDEGRIAGLMQHGVKEVIPGSKILHHVLDPGLSPYRGVSILRSSWFPYTVKRQMMVGAVVGYDRFGNPIPVIRHPEGAGDEGQDTAEQIGRDIRNNESAYVRFAGRAAGPDQDGWSIDLLESSWASPEAFLRYLDQAILSSVLAGFLSLGQTQGGNRALGDALQRPFYQALQSYGDIIADDYTNQVLTPFIRVNFGDNVPVPSLVLTGLQPNDVETLARTVHDLHMAGISFADDPAQAYLRETLGMPAPPEGAGLEGVAPVAPPAA